VATHAGHGGEPQDREEPVTGRSPQELPEFVVGPCLGFDLLQRPLLGGSGEQRDVAGHESAPMGVGRGAADEQVDLVHRLG
jgi:hypothetical protein